MPIIRVIFGRPLQVTVRFMIRVVLSVLSVSLSVCLSVCLSVTLVYCGQTVGWIEMPLGAEVGLGLGDNVLDGDSGPPRKGAQQPPLFGSCLLWPNGWMDQDTTWYGGKSQPRRHCVRWEPSSATERGTAAPTFRPTCALARSPISATAELV